MDSNTVTTAEPLIKEVSKLPRCEFCSEQATIQTADGQMELDLCGVDNHPEYKDVPMVRLQLVTAE